MAAPRRAVRISAQHASQMIRDWLDERSSDDESDIDDTGEDGNEQSNFIGPAGLEGSDDDEADDQVGQDAQPASQSHPAHAVHGGRGANAVPDNWKELTENDHDEKVYDFQFNKDAGVQEDACNRKWHASGIDPNGDLTPYDYFRLLWDDEVEETLVRMVNEYGAMRKQQNLPAKRRSLIARWEDTNKSEMRKFVAVVIQMGIDKRPSIKKYWSGSAQYSTPWFRSMFARERFELLYHSMLHASELNAEKIRRSCHF